MNKIAELAISIDPNETMRIEFSNGSVIYQPPASAVDRSGEAGTHFIVAAQHVERFMVEEALIMRDHSLSPSGQMQRLDPLAIDALGGVAVAWTGLDDFEEHLARREAELKRVPTIEPGNLLAALQDWECRDRWHASSVAERAVLLTAMDSGPGLQRMEIALLRDPCPSPLVDLESQSVRESWNRGCMLANPAETVALASGQRSLEWGRRGLLQVAAVMVSSLGADRWPVQRVLRELIASQNERVQRGYPAFGYSQAEAVAERLQQKQRAAGAAAMPPDRPLY